MLIKKSGSVCPILITLLTAGTTLGNATEVGPANGSLVVVGGNMQDESIVRRIIDLAGGPDALLVVIPTAGAAPNTNDSRNYNDSFHRLLQFRAAGARNVMLLHTRDRGVADSERFVEPLGRARGVFFDEGRQWRLADVYLNTRTHRELLSLLDRGGVIAGSSAGASILASFLARGDTKGNHIMIGDHQEGFGFLRNVAIDQHLLARNRLLDMLEIVRRHPRLLGIGIDEDTAIVVQQDQFEVIGRSHVVVYDNQHGIPPTGGIYFLAPGDRYDLLSREVWRPAQPTPMPVGRVENPVTP